MVHPSISKRARGVFDLRVAVNLVKNQKEIRSKVCSNMYTVILKVPNPKSIPRTYPPFYTLALHLPYQTPIATCNSTSREHPTPLAPRLVPSNAPAQVFLVQTQHPPQLTSSHQIPFPFLSHFSRPLPSLQPQSSPNYSFPRRLGRQSLSVGHECLLGQRSMLQLLKTRWYRFRWRAAGMASTSFRRRRGQSEHKGQPRRW